MPFCICLRITLRLEIGATHFKDRHLAVLEGEKAVAAILTELKAKLAKLRETP